MGAVNAACSAELGQRSGGGSDGLVSDGLAEVRAIQRAFPAQGVLDVYADQLGRLRRPVRGGHGGASQREQWFDVPAFPAAWRVWPGSPHSKSGGERAPSA